MSDLIHKIVGKIIEVGQSDTGKFRLGETIRYSPSEILEILIQHESEIFGEGSSTQSNDHNTLNTLDTIYRQAAIDALIKWYGCEPSDISAFENIIEKLPSAQPELIEKTAYIRGFEQGRTQGMIDAQGGKNMIKAEWTNADALNLQPTCNNLATDCISRQAVLDYIDNMPSELTADGRRMIRRIRLTEYIQDSLPSVQPEVIRCGECKHSFLHDNGEKISRICGLTRMCGTTPDDWFCADAERREE